MPDNMTKTQKRFQELTAEYEKLDAKIDPIQARMKVIREEIEGLLEKSKQTELTAPNRYRAVLVTSVTNRLVKNSLPKILTLCGKKFGFSDQQKEKLNTAFINAGLGKLTPSDIASVLKKCKHPNPAVINKFVEPVSVRTSLRLEKLKQTGVE